MHTCTYNLEAYQTPPSHPPPPPPLLPFILGLSDLLQLTILHVNFTIYNGIKIQKFQGQFTKVRKFHDKNKGAKNMHQNLSNYMFASGKLWELQVEQILGIRLIRKMISVSKMKRMHLSSISNCDTASSGSKLIRMADYNYNYNYIIIIITTSGLTGKIISAITSKGFEISALQMVSLLDCATKHCHSNKVVVFREWSSTVVN